MKLLSTSKRLWTVHVCFITRALGFLMAIDLVSVCIIQCCCQIMTSSISSAIVSAGRKEAVVGHYQFLHKRLSQRKISSFHIEMVLHQGSRCIFSFLRFDLLKARSCPNPSHSLLVCIQHVTWHVER